MGREKREIHFYVTGWIKFTGGMMIWNDRDGRCDTGGAFALVELPFDRLRAMRKREDAGSSS
ncbi:MAG: hypothetical protein KGZ25_14790, partial [Planctomycetes bacterium]|nr:hypothetical protein [Planctomycetota bacterium]